MTKKIVARADNPPLEFVIAGLQEIARAEILKEWRADSCIASTRIALNVLAHFGYKAAPIPCRAYCFNPPLARRLRALGKRGDDWDGKFRAGEWSVGIGATPNYAGLVEGIYSEARARGRMLVAELRQLTAQGFPAIQYVADEWNIAPRQVTAHCEQGLVSFPRAEKIFARLRNFAPMPKPQNWTGHLVAVTSTDILIDLSIDQANRPQYNLTFAPFVAQLPADWQAWNAPIEYDTPNGCVVMYEFTRDARYSDAPDWTDVMRHVRASARLVARIGAEWERQGAAWQARE